MDSFTTTNAPSMDGKRHSRLAPERPPICGESVVLPLGLALTALGYAGRPDIEPADIQDVRCTLQAHPPGGDHYAFVVEATATTGAWTRWAQVAGPDVVLVLPDCTAKNPERDETCSEYEGHGGGHTWQVDDPFNLVESAR